MLEILERLDLPGKNIQIYYYCNCDKNGCTEKDELNKYTKSE